MLVLLLVPKVVAAVNSVVTSALGGILFDFSYYYSGVIWPPRSNI